MNPPEVDSTALSSNNGKRWLTPKQRRELNRVLAADMPSAPPLPPRAVRRRQMAEHGAPALGVSKREAWKLYQLTKGC